MVKGTIISQHSMDTAMRKVITAIVAAVLWLGSELGGRAEAGIALQTPAGLNPGDHFRFVFVTDDIRDATSTNIADYDSFVNAQAGGATYSGVVVNWLAIGSTDSVDAIDHVGQTTAPVYLSDGTLVTTSTTLTGLWSRTLLQAIKLDLAGNPVPPFTFVWSGTNSFGTGFGGPLGSPTPLVGSPFFTNDAWIASGRSPSGDLRNLYGISTDLVVSSAVPEPSSLVLLGTALSVGLAICKVQIASVLGPPERNHDVTRADHGALLLGQEVRTNALSRAEAFVPRLSSRSSYLPLVCRMPPPSDSIHARNWLQTGVDVPSDSH
jgi:hypothetical protein